MSAAPDNRAIRLRDWASYYADRWQVDFRSLANQTYGPDAIPMPGELRRQVSLLHEIAADLDRLLPLGEQGFYWHHLCGPEERPPAARLESERGCLTVVRNELRMFSDLVAIEEGTFEPGVRALAALLSSLKAADALTQGDVSSEQRVEPETTPFDLWGDWPDSLAVGRLLGSTASEPQRVATRLRSKGQLLGVCSPFEHRMRFPPCQFRDSGTLPVMRELLLALPEGSGSGWIKAFWLYSANGALSGHLPADLLGDQSEAVLDAARTFTQPQPYFGW